MKLALDLSNLTVPSGVSPETRTELVKRVFEQDAFLGAEVGVAEGGEEVTVHYREISAKQLALFFAEISCPEITLYRLGIIKPDEKKD